MEDVGRAPGCAIILLTCYKGCFKKVSMKCMYVAFLSNPPPRNLLPDSKNLPSLWSGSVETEMWEGGGEGRKKKAGTWKLSLVFTSDANINVRISSISTPSVC